jgi:hypothetical protein
MQSFFKGHHKRTFLQGPTCSNTTPTSSASHVQHQGHHTSITISFYHHTIDRLHHYTFSSIICSISGLFVAALCMWSSCSSIYNSHRSSLNP